MRTFSARQALLALQHLPKLGEDALGLFDMGRLAVDLDAVAARDDPHRQRIANQPEMLIAIAEELDRFIAVVQSQSQGGVAHGFHFRRKNQR